MPDRRNLLLCALASPLGLGAAPPAPSTSAATPAATPAATETPTPAPPSAPKAATPSAQTPSAQTPSAQTSAPGAAPGTAPGTAPALPSPQAVADALGARDAPAGATEKTVLVTRVAGGADQDARRFQVLDNGQGSVLVRFLDALDQGQQVLSTDTEMWFLGSGSRRAIKIPPIQRAFGDASLGDLARLDLGRDYQVADIAPGTGDLAQAVQAKLVARSPVATYSQVVIWLGARDLQPLRAHYYLASGKHGKTAVFQRNRRVGVGWQSDERLLSEPAQPQRATRVAIESVTARSFPPQWFTPRHMEMQR